MSMVNALGWALLHFIWQGCFIAIAVGIAFNLSRDPRRRHSMACGALALMLFSFLTTLVSLLPDRTFDEEAAQQTVTLNKMLAGGLPLTNHQWADKINYVVMFWALGVLLVGCYQAAGWLYLQRLRRSGVPPESMWQERFAVLVKRMLISCPVQLLESGLVQAPIVVGLLKPLVLIPIGMLSLMPAEQVELILLHELAHVFRRDWIVNLIQTVVETLLFHHPAVWWVSNLVRQEREKCCDDLVVAIKGNTRNYAAALLGLEEQRAVNGTTAIAATGGNLQMRIQRLVGVQEMGRVHVAPIAMLSTMLIAVYCIASYAQQAASPWTNWLNEDVVYIITAEEKRTFQALKSDSEREKFSEQFWKRRDPKPETAVNEFKEEHYRRIDFANQKFVGSKAGWRTDPGHVYIVYGPPDELEMHKGVKQEWLYRQIPKVGKDVIIRFTFKNGEYVWDSDPRNKTQ